MLRSINSMTGPKLIVAIAVVLAAVSVIADLITISQFDFHLWDPFVGNSSTEHSASPGQSASPRPTVIPTATPSPTPTVKGGRITGHCGGEKVYHWSRRWSAIMSAPSELGLRSEVSPRTA